MPRKNHTPASIERRRERNRDAATRLRTRRKCQLETLTEEVEKLKKEIAAKDKQIAELQADFSCHRPVFPSAFAFAPCSSSTSTSGASPTEPAPIKHSNRPKSFEYMSDYSLVWQSPKVTPMVRPAPQAVTIGTAASGNANVFTATAYLLHPCSGDTPMEMGRYLPRGDLGSFSSDPQFTPLFTLSPMRLRSESNVLFPSPTNDLTRL